MPRPKKIKDFNENYFSKPNTENSYWAGFIATDGNISLDWYCRMTLRFAVTDKVAVEQLVECLGGNKSKIKIITADKMNRYKKHIVSKKDLYSINFISNRLCGDLWTNFNIRVGMYDNAKTYTLLPPDLTDMECIKSFLIGTIDGDGHITNTEKTKLKFGLCGVSLPFIEWCNKKFAEIGECSKATISTINTDPNRYYDIYSIQYSCSKAIKILTELNKVNVPKLKRKWDKVCQEKDR